MGCDELRKLVRPPDERQLERRFAARARPYDRGVPRRGGDWQRPLLHLRIERRRVLERPDAQLLAQRADAAAVLLQGISAVAGPAVEPDQLAMRGFMDGIDLEPPLRMLDGSFVLATGDERLDQAPEHRPQLSTKALCFGRLPVLEVRAVTHEEALEQLAGGEGRRLAETFQRGAGPRERPEPSDVELEAGSSTQGDAVASGIDPFRSDRPAKR